MDQGVRRVLGPARILPPTHLRPLKLPKLKTTEGLTCRVSSDHCYFFYNWKILDEPPGVKNMHPRADAVMAKLLAKSESLWLYCIAGSGVKLEKAVVRTTAQNALKKAFCIALARYGFDATGKRLGPPPPGRARLPDPGGDTSADSALHGTILLRAKDPKGLLKADFESLVNDMERLLRDILKHLARRLPDGTVRRSREARRTEQAQAWNPQRQGNRTRERK